MAATTPESAASRQMAMKGLVIRLGRSNVAVTLMLFALILVLKWPVLSEPPVWDASMSVFPAAITLAENDFDYGHLLSRPGYLDGGPNVHSLSPVALVTAAVYTLIGPNSARFPILHVIHFGIAAFAFMGIYRLGERAVGSTLAATATITALMIPVVLTQVGSMYLEIALLAAAAHAALAWHRRREYVAALWLVVAVLIKGSGVFVAAALTGATLLSGQDWPHKFRSASLLLVPSTVLGLLLQTTAAVEPTFSYSVFRRESAWYLLHIPDVLLLLTLMTIVAIITVWRGVREHHDPAPGRDSSGAVLATTVLILVAFVGFYFVLLPLTGRFFSVLPRYYTVVVPFLIVGLTAAAHQIGFRRLALGSLGLTLVFSIVNRNGDLYPDNDLENFALIERSGAYTALLELQQEGIDALVDAASEVPAFYTHVEHYRFTYPELGYVDDSLPTGHNLKTDQPYSEGRLEDFPPDFVMLYEWSWLGGDVVKSIWDQALADPQRTVEERSISVGEYQSTLIHVSSH